MSRTSSTGSNTAFGRSSGGGTNPYALGTGGDSSSGGNNTTTITSPSSSSSSALLSSNHILFCANPVLFENCGLLLDSPSGLTIAAVLKLRQASSNMTAISLANWKDIAVNVMGLRDVNAYSIFDVFFALSGGCMQGSPAYYAARSVTDSRPIADFRQESNRALLNKMGGSVDEARWPAASTSRHVSLPGLILFLLTQLLLERPPREALGEVSSELIARSLRQNLHDYVSAVAVSRPGRVTMVDVLELRFLLREFVNGVEQPFGTSLALNWPGKEKTIDLAVLLQFIRPRIVLPSEVIAAYPPNRSPQPPSSSSPPLVTPFSNNMVVHGLQDTMYIPPTPLFGDTAMALLSTNFTITECAQTSFYIASNLPHTRLSLLSNCTVTMGPVGGVLCVDRCHNCVISALCGAVVVSHCSDVTLYVCTNTPPVLCLHEGAGTLHNVRFAPYNSFYSTLEEHLSRAGISPTLNLWNVGLPSSQYLLPADEFNPICFPVAPMASADFTTNTNPCVLPQVYADALTRRLRRFQDVSRELQSTYRRLEEANRRDLAEQLRGKVHHLFVEWLQESGQGKGLLDLLHQSATGQ